MEVREAQDQRQSCSQGLRDKRGRIVVSMLGDMSVDAGDFSSKNAARLSISFDANAQSGMVESNLYYYETVSGAIRKYAVAPWKVISIAHSRRTGGLLTFALGEDGQMFVFEKLTAWERPLTATPAYEGGRGPLRKIRAFGDAVLAVGMDRQVYEFQLDETWANRSAPGTRAKPVTGFEAVTGAGGDDFYCAGWHGEIWHCAAGAWHQIDSPTNILITDLTVAGNTVYGCGLAGLILAGSGRRWRVLDQGAFNLDLYSICAYQSRIFAASLHGVYELKQDKLYAVDFGIKPPKTAHTLCSVADGLGVIGAKDLFFFDGTSWRKLE
jgi:hypothetical protein